MTIQQIKQRYGIIGSDPTLNTAVEMAIQVAPTDVSVLVYGENGTGKDIFSRIIHDNSKRRHKRLIAINTGAIPEGTLDSELFGHEKGAFTSAYEARKGYFEEVEGGTIFLDEISEMPLATQARLLRLLENGEYLRVGSSKVQNTDVRVIAATNRDLIELIQQGRFRQDLYFRLNRITMLVPPLRERGEDIELLFNYFAHEFAEKYKREAIVLAPESIPLLYQYRWPGNVRELRNLVEKLSLLVKNEWVTSDLLRSNLLVQDSYLPSVIRISSDENGVQSESYDSAEIDRLYQLIYDMGKQLNQEIAELKKMVYLGFKNADITPGQYPMQGGNYAQPYHAGDANQSLQPNIPRLEESLSLERKEKELIIKALNKHSNNRKKAAADLGISERTLYRKIKNYDIAL